ncbi:MAG: acetyl-CoA carboxylase biotin carboxyl carrier protein [Clostridia bacterium]|nr:acetyl-CoA carboxylase biotin carboxyl carrier protein [Clostridia bacterium]
MDISYSLKELEKLADFMEERGLIALEINEDGVRMERGAAPVAAAPVVSTSAPAAQSAAKPEEKKESGGEISGKAVKSPMVGVYYEAPSPGEEPFVHLGDKVKKGDVLCIVEAMKLLNEITADEDGEIVKICATDGQVVEYGQCLFLIK